VSDAVDRSDDVDFLKWKEDAKKFNEIAGKMQKNDLLKF